MKLRAWFKYRNGKFIDSKFSPRCYFESAEKTKDGGELSLAKWAVWKHLGCFRFCSFSVQFSHSVVSDSLRRHESQQPVLPVHHQLPEFTQTHVHRVSDAIQPSHPLSSPSPPAPNPSQHQSFPMSQLFAWGGQSTGVSASASFPPKKFQGWSPSEWTGWISLH